MTLRSRAVAVTGRLSASYFVLLEWISPAGVAVAQLAQAVKIDPSAVNFLLLAQALRRAGRPAEADAASAQAQKISPDLNQAQIVAAQFLSWAGLKPL